MSDREPNPPADRPASDGRPDEPPPYKVYRARPGLLRRDKPLRTGAGSGPPVGHESGPAVERPTPDGPPEYTVHRSGRGGRFGGGRGGGIPRGGAPAGSGRSRSRPSVGALVRYLLLGIAAWGLVSLILFMVSAQIQRQQVSDAARTALTPGGFTLSSPNTVLILGSDARTKANAEPGAKVGGPSRSDSIMLMHIGGGRNATLSIPRDTVVDIPGSGRNKINAAYAIGGPALAIQTVEQYLGTPVNHLVEVNFENFPALIDSLGGVNVKTGCVVSLINGGNRNGGYTLRLKAGKNHLSGDQALALARTRKNQCRPREDDRTRARRQQLILAAIKRQVVSPETFVRLPWVSWQGPKAIRSDMAGPDLLGLVGATLLGGSGHTAVLKPSADVRLPDGGAGLAVSEEEKAREVQRLLEG